MSEDDREQDGERESSWKNVAPDVPFPERVERWREWKRRTSTPSNGGADIKAYLVTGKSGEGEDR